jgi:hypothetical protein
VSPAKRTARRKSAKRAAKPKRTSKPKRAAKAKRKAAPKRKTARRAATLTLVAKKKPAPARKRTRAAATAAFAAAKAGASARDLALFEFVRARVAVHAAIQGLTAASADRPVAPGKWTPREIVLHLAYWDREMLPALEDAYRHDRRPAMTHDDVMDRNPAGVAELSHHDWESAKRLLQLHRERLLEALQSLPEEPAEMWVKPHAVGWLVRLLTDHDRHHADVLKAARVPAE